MLVISVSWLLSRNVMSIIKYLLQKQLNVFMLTSVYWNITFYVTHNFQVIQ